VGKASPQGKSYEPLRDRPSCHCCPRISSRPRKGSNRFHHGHSQGRHGCRGSSNYNRITAQNVATNAPRTAVTDESGIYRITSLAPGTYNVLIEKPGFKSVEFSQITLAVDHVQNLDATLTEGTPSKSFWRDTQPFRASWQSPRSKKHNNS
jgi:hypothetical protein